MEMRIAGEELQATLRKHGVVLLRGQFAKEPLMRMREAAGRCFAAVEGASPAAGHYRFNRYANSILLKALLDFGLESEADLLAPLAVDGLGAIFSELIGGPWRCELEHSWARKKFAPGNTPGSGYRLQDWHQDGALGVQFPLQPGPMPPMTRLATCWIPLHACGRESPGLEFIQQAQPTLLHFTELDDAALRARFAPAAFWAPELDFGDGVVFRNDVLHRTYVNADMPNDRLSVEYRIFAEGSAKPLHPGGSPISSG